MKLSKYALLLTGWLKRIILEEKVKFLIVGGLNTLFGYGCFFVLYGQLGRFVNYLLITAISHFISVCFSFFLYRSFVFSSKKTRILWAFFKYNVAVLNSLGLGLVLMFIFVNSLEFTPVVAQALMMVVLVVTNFVLHKYFTFR